MVLRPDHGEQMQGQGLLLMVSRYRVGPKVMHPRNQIAAGFRGWCSHAVVIAAMFAIVPASPCPIQSAHIIFFARNANNREKRPSPPAFHDGLWQHEVLPKGANTMGDI
jgi:hypothetical protein